MQTQHHNILPPHLGGHLNKTHIDEGALTYLCRVFKHNTFLDVGCGPGGMVLLAAKKGLKAVGIDGDFTLPIFQRDYVAPEKVTFIQHDFADSHLPHNPVPYYDMFDLVWSVEFLEHVHECHLPRVMRVLTYSNVVVVTAAPPGWPGHHHVNCQTEDYWKGVFAGYGFTFDAINTYGIRHASTMCKPFMQNTGMIFVREKGAA